MEPFVHLHVHSQYSLLDGQASISRLVDKAIADGMPGIALTDHGNMMGVKEMYNYTNKLNKKRKEEGLEPFLPIFGCEMYVARTSLLEKKDKGDHLIVLAKNLQGYKNLIKLVSKAWTDGFFHHPRTDHDELKAHHEGLIVCSACIAGEVPRLIRQGKIQEAEQRILWFKEIFGDDYYLELQRHKPDCEPSNHEAYEVQQQVNPVLIEMAHKHGIKLVATNDVHFVNRDDANAHDHLLCISTGKNISDPTRMLYSKQEWLKSQQEMNEIFADVPEALSNTYELWKKVEKYSIDHGPIMPEFRIPEEFGTEAQWREKYTEEDLFNEFTQDENGNVVLSQEKAEAKIKALGGYDKLYRIKFEADYLAKLAYDGAKKRYGDPLEPEIAERIKFELYIMKTMGFPGYFLIVNDFITAAREKLGVSVGPGRGSAAGSAVAYCLGITQIDPIKYDLLFERFLNPDRISLPDIDIDFDDDGREIVLGYVTQKYGAEKVAHIITYGTMAAKSSIKDVARVEELPLNEANRLAKYIPGPTEKINVDGNQYKATLENCYKYIPELKNELQSPNMTIRRTLQYAKQLEGNVRNVGVHACGVIICRDDITDWVPVATAKDKNDDKVLVTQYEGSVIEETGLIKMDFLGLKTLSIIKEAISNIKLHRGIDVDIDDQSILEDKKTYELFCNGNTKGTFQFESVGMQRYLRELQPSTFEDLIAMNALFRPGPMDNIPEFISRKHGQTPIEYDIPVMSKYLKDTYGITVYQEQVMLLSRLLANFTRGQSDTLRKAMGKKIISKMQELKVTFMEGGQANGHSPEILEKIWADWEKFASYAFNKSHATCYSWVAFQTAYLKANYPAEYMAAVLSRNITDQSKLVNYMDECKAMKIRILGPDINESYTKFSVTPSGDIRFGLTAISGIGSKVVDEIIRVRDAGGPFKDIYDFVERMPAGSFNRRNFENMALAGVFDSFKDIKREDLLEKNAKDENMCEILLKYGVNYQTSKSQTGGSLFDGFLEETDYTATRPEIHPVQPWTPMELLNKEKELVGMYLSAHPLDPYYMELTYGCSHNIQSLSEDTPKEGREVTFGGLVESFTSKPARNGGQYGILKIEDYTGVMELRLFGKDFIEYSKYGQPGTPILIFGRYDKRYNSNELVLNIASIRLLEEVKDHLISGITVDMDAKQLTRQNMEIFSEHMHGPKVNVGTLDFNIHDREAGRSVRMTSGLRIPITRPLIDMLKELELEFKVASQKLVAPQPAQPKWGQYHKKN